MRLLYFLRAIFGVLVFLPVCTLYSSAKLILGHYFGDRASIGDRVALGWSTSILRFFSIKIVQTGRENIPKDACLFLFNHTSWLDIFALSSCQPKIRYGAKIELFRIPIFSSAMRLAGILPIARNKLSDVIRVYKEAESRAQHGDQFALAPEGTRSETEELRHFKSGPFLFAINAGLPIVPVVIKGAAAAWPKQSWIPQTASWSTTITVEFLPVVAVNSYKPEQKRQLQQLVYTQMKSHFW